MDSLFCSISSILIFIYRNKIINLLKKKFIMAFYFGYGSNMSQVYLEKVRYVYPKKSTVGHIKDYALKINLKGPNFVEPGFANIRYQKGSKVEGILHEISDIELKKIIASEGPEYEVFEIPVFTNKKRFLAKTLIWPTETLEELPTSRRYLNLLIKAAKENKLSDEYIEEIKMKKTVYYPFLSEYYKIYAYFWVKSRARKVNDNI
jgi:hypothetical protein